jgi:hypothetical protein
VPWLTSANTSKPIPKIGYKTNSTSNKVNFEAEFKIC